MVHSVLRLFWACSVGFILLASLTSVHSRYLPTRSNEDSLDKLRDLLRDILESDKPQPASHLPSLYGNEVQSSHGGNYGSDRYPFGGPKYLRKREIPGWEFYDPSQSLTVPRH